MQLEAWLEGARYWLVELHGWWPVAGGCRLLPAACRSTTATAARVANLPCLLDMTIPRVFAYREL